MLAAAAPLYEFNGPDLKPWHLKGTYQLYDQNGKAGEQGTYEYWWVAPKVFRSSWTRAAATRTDWHIAGGRNLSKTSGDRLSFIEEQLQLLLFSPLPDLAKADPHDFEFAKDRLQIGKITFPCVNVIPHKRKDGTWPVLSESSLRVFCFDPTTPVLRIARGAEVLSFEFDHLKKFQNRILSGGITIVYGNQKLLTFTVDTISPIASDDADVVPPADAMPSLPLGLTDPSATQGRLAKKASPVYPMAARSAHITGTVVLDVMIGADGKPKDLRVVGSPSQLLTQASLDSVSQWQYEPYLLDGHPVEMNTMIHVIFSMSP
jgi:TonB family protein